MPVFFGHRTAELILDKLTSEQLSLASDQRLEYCWASRTKLSQVDLSLLSGIEKPLDVLVAKHKELRHWEGVRCHRCTEDLPLGAFYEIAPEVYVASPALCFVQRARELTLAQTVALGTRLCGTYALDKSSPTGIRERRPLVSVEDLKDFVERCPKMLDVSRARRATSLVLPDSASPMETVMQIVLCFPRRLGGLGLPLPEMNVRHTLSNRARKLYDKEFIRIDVFWRDMDLGLEYQGEYAHGTYAKFAEDIARQLAAEQDGIELQMLTVEQLRDREQRLFVAQKIARRLGVTLSVGKNLLDRNQSLFEELVGEGGLAQV